VGAFYQPRAVFIDSEVLRSLPREELLNGLAEVIKYGIIYDRDFFDFLASFRQAILDLDLAVLESVVKACCTIKAKVVEADETEADFRRILNYGHTIGHAVEAASGYGLAHGSAVAIGMVAAARIARHQSLLSPREMEKISDLIAAFGLPVEIPPELDRNQIKEYLKTDKKAVDGCPFFVLPITIGKVRISDKVSEEMIDAAIGLKSDP
jgi:3-dehydroquinate synthase